MVVLAGGAWERALGELLTSAEARVLLGGISREALRKRVVSGSVIALRDDAGLVRYPRWQFDATSGAPFGAIKELNEIFRRCGGRRVDACLLCHHSPAGAWQPGTGRCLRRYGHRASASLGSPHRCRPEALSPRDLPALRTTCPSFPARSSRRSPYGESMPPTSLPGSSMLAPTVGSTSLSRALATWPRSRLAPSSRNSGAYCGRTGQSRSRWSTRNGYPRCAHP
jgi:hypothetical protein